MNELQLEYGTVLALVEIVCDYESIDTVAELKDYLSENSENIITITIEEEN